MTWTAIAIVLGTALVTAPAFAQQPPQGVTGALGSGSPATTAPGFGDVSNGALTSPSAPTTVGPGSFGSPSGSTLGNLGGFRSPSPGGAPSPATPSISPPPIGSGLTTNPATGVSGR